MHTDPISDMLTRIRNTARAGQLHLTCPASKIKEEILRVLKEQGFIETYVRQESARGHDELAITLFPDSKELVIKRTSKPGRRDYVSTDNLPVVLNGFGTAVVSTSQGVMTNSEAREKHIGGEVLCEIW